MKKIISKIKLAAAVLVLGPACAAARDTAALTLTGAVSRTIAHSYDLKSRDAAVAQAEAAVRHANSMRLPGLNLRSDLTRGDDPVYVFGTLLRQGKFGMQDFAIDKLNDPSYKVNFANSLELGVPLFTGFRISNYKKLGETAVLQGKAVRAFAGTAEAFQSAQKYLMLFLKTELARIAAETVASTKEEVAAAGRLKEKGLVLGSDYYAAQAALSSLSAAQTGFEKDAEAASASLNVLMGSEPGTKIALPGAFPKHLYALPAENDLVKDISRRRGDITAARLQGEAAEIAKSIEADSILPQIGAFASLQTNSTTLHDTPFQRMIGVGMTLPFGDLTRGARIDEKKALKAQADNSALAMQDAAAAQIAEYYRNYESALAVLPLTEEALAGAQLSLDLFKPMFRQGRQSVLEVVRAESALMNARAARAEAIFKLHSYYLALMFISGGLDEARTSEISAALSGEIQ